MPLKHLKLGGPSNCARETGPKHVSKSVLFSRLTGLRVIISSYPGTIVSYMERTMTLDQDREAATGG